MRSGQCFRSQSGFLIRSKTSEEKVTMDPQAKAPIWTQLFWEKAPPAVSNDYTEQKLSSVIHLDDL